MLYIKKFDTLSAQTQYLTDNEVDTYVGYVVENDTVYYDDAIIINYAKKYLTIETLEDGVLTFPNSMENTAYYSIDNGEWELLTSASTVNIGSGHEVRFKKGQMMPNPIGGINILCTIRFSGSHNVFGNAASLYYGDDFVNVDTQTKNSALFGFLFYNDSKLISAENLVLPWGKMQPESYSSMFNGCTSLTTAPELPATTLAANCYRSMFAGCTSLTTTPQLPATTMASGCYNGMFSGCTSLETAPELPATTLASNCYAHMFNGCTSLETAPELLASELATSCYANMFWNCSNLSYVKMMGYPVAITNTSNWLSGVASSGTLVTYCDTELSSGGSGLPNGWTQVKQDYDGTECSTGGDYAD